MPKQHADVEVVSVFNEYPVWPEDDGTDKKRNPYSPV
jgi:hypothetical protein